jgi:hypothetical protein
MKRWLGFKDLVGDVLIGVHQMVNEASTRPITTVADIARTAPVNPSIRDGVELVRRDTTHLAILPTWRYYPLGDATHLAMLPTWRCYPLGDIAPRDSEF